MWIELHSVIYMTLTAAVETFHSGRVTTVEIPVTSVDHLAGTLMAKMSQPLHHHLSHLHES